MSNANHNFIHQKYDWQTGVYYYRARSYDSHLGRFLQRDPAGMVDGPNMYAYCGNGPVNNRDPSGLEFGGCVVWCQVGGTAFSPQIEIYWWPDGEENKRYCIKTGTFYCTLFGMVCDFITPLAELETLDENWCEDNYCRSPNAYHGGIDAWNSIAGVNKENIMLDYGGNTRGGVPSHLWERHGKYKVAIL